MNRLHALIFSALVMIGVAACSASEPHLPGATAESRQPEPPPPDTGDIAHFHACKAPPRRTLSERERCQIEKLAARCTPADDCLVSCLASPDADKVGGRCVHTCFSGVHRGEPRPAGFADCDSLPGGSNMDSGD
ncbi:hypothetical protein [Lysobacter gummosus]|uniref:Lipoprotein n=1 Tax=Lysobacter gummosus TaxID=262324 RepID=A0ABY3XHH0_9GAMM|nr:hypothetical protein [Lysobacter gummosus]ALN90597.1 putative integron gene cassette protein [Lysobacter gummosus]UNP31095.1 hypothetical protein MOV92_07565 [Lysobacter gummosus]